MCKMTNSEFIESVKLEVKLKREGRIAEAKKVVDERSYLLNREKPFVEQFSSRVHANYAVGSNSRVARSCWQ